LDPRIPAKIRVRSGNGFEIRPGMESAADDDPTMTSLSSVPPQRVDTLVMDAFQGAGRNLSGTIHHRTRNLYSWRPIVSLSSATNMNRRRFVLAIGGLAAAQTRAFGTTGLFLNYDQHALDEAYDQRIWAPDSAKVIARYATDSAEARKTHPPTTISYGQSDAETLDIFSPKGADASTRYPVMVFVHGGAWRALSKDDASAPAPAFVDNGCLYVALNFANIPAARMPDMANQCRNAMLWIHRNIARFGGDPSRIFVSGHSSGAHLGAVLLTTDWSSYQAPAKLIKGGVMMSGMYELYPVMLSSRSSYVRLNEREIADLSPLRHMDKLNCPVLVVNGDRESPEFQRQAKEFATVLAGMGMSSGHVVLPGKNHFEVPEEFNDANSALSKSVLAMMSSGRERSFIR
jgi:arylformamidase